jgi:hypothetical protein
MHFDLKPISAASIPEAFTKVERYRFLNEPDLAESICLDILAIVPTDQPVLISLLLARTEQFGGGTTAAMAQEVLARIEGDYERAYYAGIISERMGHAYLRQAGPGRAAAAYHALRQAMEHFERAEALRPPGNDDAILRWNTCARILMRNPEIRPLPDCQIPSSSRSRANSPRYARSPADDKIVGIQPPHIGP